MKRSLTRLYSVIYLLLLSAFLFPLGAQESRAQAAILPKPGWSSCPGRLVGWGKFSDSRPVEKLLPTGIEAEGFVAVASGPHWFVVLRSDGAVFVNGERRDDYLPAEKITHLSSRPNMSVLVGYEDGTFNFKRGGEMRASTSRLPRM